MFVGSSQVHNPKRDMLGVNRIQAHHRKHTGCLATPLALTHSFLGCRVGPVHQLVLPPAPQRAVDGVRTGDDTGHQYTWRLLQGVTARLGGPEGAVPAAQPGARGVLQGHGGHSPPWTRGRED